MDSPYRLVGAEVRIDLTKGGMYEGTVDGTDEMFLSIEDDKGTRRLIAFTAIRVITFLKDAPLSPTGSQGSEGIGYADYANATQENNPDGSVTIIVPHNPL